jgi:hypothetical protein
MMRSLETRRQEIVRKLSHINRAIAATQKRLAAIEARVAVLTQTKAKAA